jgi:putative hemolysin
MDVTAILILLFLSSFFSGSESALFSIHWWRINYLRQHGGPGGKRLAALMDHPGSVLMTILMGNTIVNVASSALFEHWLEKNLPQHALFVAIGVMTVIILVFCEITPKTIAVLIPEKIGLFVTPPIKILSLAVSPVRILIEKFSGTLAQKLRISRTSPIKTDFFTLVDEGRQAGVLTRTEQQFMTRILEMNSVQISDVMIPRTEMVALPDTITFDQAIDAFLKHGFKRIPLYNTSIDNVTGIIYALDLLGGKLNPALRRSPKSLSQPPVFVPSHISLKQLSREFTERKRHLAIVLDEYGGTAGMVTHDDLLLAVFGSSDQNDSEKWVLKKTPGGGLRIDARITWQILCGLIGMCVRDVPFRTLNGFLMDYFGCVPAPGMTMILSGRDGGGDIDWKVTIGDTAPQRILDVYLEPVRYRNNDEDGVMAGSDPQETRS